MLKIVATSVLASFVSLPSCDCDLEPPFDADVWLPAPVADTEGPVSVQIDQVGTESGLLCSWQPSGSSAPESLGAAGSTGAAGAGGGGAEGAGWICNGEFAKYSYEWRRVVDYTHQYRVIARGPAGSAEEHIEAVDGGSGEGCDTRPELWIPPELLESVGVALD